ncbi:hypothetical protein I3842_11G094200 [Carya illinoinensis]|uniref:Uncharacterized protein n=1 Tax=Carya illinoinensis TaxID=32201 RepID=A0A922DP67_CARIL|nr:hypothetical protein I3842_11G094200 [Carya illinoinensis]
MMQDRPFGQGKPNDAGKWFIRAAQIEAIAFQQTS